MNIHEAIVVAGIESCWIRRKGWCEGHAIMPTDSQKTAMVMVTPTKVQIRWDLLASDLLATDWEIVEAEYRGRGNDEYYRNGNRCNSADLGDADYGIHDDAEQKSE